MLVTGLVQLGIQDTPLSSSTIQNSAISCCCCCCCCLLLLAACCCCCCCSSCCYISQEPDRPVSSSVNSILLRRHSSWDVCSLSSSVSSICSLASSMTGSSLPADDMDFLLESLRAVFTCRGRSTSQAAWEHCGHARCRAWRSVLDHELQCLLLQHSGSGCRAVRELHEVGHQHARQCEEAYCPVTFCR